MQLDLILKFKKKIGISCKKNHKENYALIIGRYKILQSIYLLFCSLALNKEKKINQYFLDERHLSETEKNLFTIFGVKPKFYYQDINLLSFIVILIQSILLFIKASYIIIFCNFEKFVKTFKVVNVNIGDLVFDSYLRFGHRFLNPKYDIYLIYYLFSAIYKTLLIDKFFDEQKMKFLIISGHTYANTNGISTRVALKKKIKVIMTSHRELNFFTQEKIDKGRYFLNNKNGLKQLKRVSYSKKKFLKFCRSRKRLSSDFLFTAKRDFLRAYGSKKIFTKKQFLKKLNVKKDKFERIIVVAPHAFSDAAHSLGRIFIFTDYFSHLKETLNHIKHIKNILWIVRPHPSSSFYGEQGIVENMVKEMNCHNIKICPKKINTDNLTTLTDGVVTGRGKIALEFASFGKPALIAGKCSFSGLGFLLEPENKKEYMYFLTNFGKLKHLNKKQIEKARKISMYFEKYNENHVFENKLVPNFKNKKISSVLTEINKNLNKKHDFLTSKYFINISERIRSL